jgi:hypothetical protein
VAEKTKKAETAEKTEVKKHKGHASTPSREQQKCREKDCKHHYKAKGYCVKHYRLWRQGKLGKKQRYKTCGKEGCHKPMVLRGLCAEHSKPAEAAAASA